MAWRDLRAWLAALETRGELARVADEVDPRFEITEIAQRATRAGGPAVLLENVKGHDLPVAVNLFGTEGRMADALGVSALDEIGGRIRDLLTPPRGAGLGEAAALFPKLLGAKGWFPKKVRKAPCQEIVLKGDDATLSALPIPTLWPGDAGPYVCFTQVITADPETGARNVGAYRCQVHDERTLGMHWQLHKDGKRHEDSARRRRERIPVAVALGGEPEAMYAATAPLPPGIDEYLFAGFIANRPVELAKAATSDLLVPARAEVVIEGTVDPEETMVEGPFGDHTGYYSHAGPYPVLRVEAITMRKDAVYPHIVVGKPLQEDWFLGRATERLFLPLVQLVVPEIIDMHFPPEGVFHNCLLVRIDKRYPGQARKVIHAIWGLGMLSLTKLVVVVDSDVDVQDASVAAFHALANVDPARDLVLDRGAVDVLDHASPVEGFGGKAGVDATRKVAGEGSIREWPAQVDADPAAAARVASICVELGI